MSTIRREKFSSFAFLSIEWELLREIRKVDIIIYEFAIAKFRKKMMLEIFEFELILFVISMWN